jgi:hypothetical protein
MPGRCRDDASSGVFDGATVEDVELDLSGDCAAFDRPALALQISATVEAVSTQSHISTRPFMAVTQGGWRQRTCNFRKAAPALVDEARRDLPVDLLDLGALAVEVGDVAAELEGALGNALDGAGW